MVGIDEVARDDAESYLMLITCKRVADEILND